MNLLSVQAQGVLYTVCLFLICAIAVHGFKLARIGYKTLRKKTPEPPPKSEKPPQEPVYFIVERKKKRPKSEYTEPRRFQFK